jgi:tyrosine-protein phosphatase SIW14
VHRFVQHFLGVAIAVLLVAVPVGYGFYCQGRLRNLHVVRDGVLYRSGQMSIAGLQQVIHDFGIKTVVTLRDAADPNDRPPDWGEEQFCLAKGINYVRISPRSWWSPDGSVPAEKGVSKFRAVMDDKRYYPVLIHCFAGVHRTGAFCAVYRMEYEKWSNAQALAELRQHGYTHLDDEWDLLDYLENYQPRRQRHDPLEAEER